MVRMAQPSDEHRQPAGPDPWWADAWEIDFAATSGPAAEAGIGGFVRLALLPNQGVAWWWTGLLTPRLVAVRDHEVPLPRAGLEIRADGLWGALVCETPLEHWSIGLEAFGIAYDDPADAWGDEWGERLPVGLDLEWEATAGPGGTSPAGPPPDGPGAVGYAQPGRVHGEILVGADTRIEFGGAGFRSRTSGVLDWWSGGPHHRLALVAGDGRAVEDGGRAAEPLGEAPVLVTAAARPPVRLARRLCRLDDPSGPVTGWEERFPA
jgi:hypothetical protein